MKFRKILNDLKRRPEDASIELKISKKKILDILSGKKKIPFSLIEKAVKIWPINYSDFFHIEDDAPKGYKIYHSKLSDKSSRKMYRAGKPYYLYKDTVMSKISSFRPEWIQQLVIVKNNKPKNKSVVFNNGHFLHQFTYFIGPVNFYYMDGKIKKVALMNTGDSMHINPYIPHSFTTRQNKKGELGCILALTYTDKIDGEFINELTAVGLENSKKFKLDTSSKKKSILSLIDYNLNISSITKKNLKEDFKIDLKNLLKNNKINYSLVDKVAQILNISSRELIPHGKFDYVKINKYKNNRSWYYPSSSQKKYLIVELANSIILPNSKAYELTVINSKKKNIFFEVQSHQYVYNIGKTTCNINFGNKKEEKISPGDSLYIKPNVKHEFFKKSKLLILRIGGKITGDGLIQLSSLKNSDYKRLINDNKQWFN